jgi:VanZ family protein
MTVTGKRSAYIFMQWIPPLLGVGCIMLESTDLFSSQHTGSFLYGLLTAIFGEINQARFDVVHHLLRKSGHLTGYAILSLLFFRALRNTVTTNLERLWFSSIALTALVASLDEWHQSFIPSRTGSIYDVLLDTLGALLVQTAIVAARRARCRRPVES